MDSRFDWIVGAYYLRGRVSQFNRYWGESPWSGLIAGLNTLTGQSNWIDRGTTISYAGFAQVGG